MHKRCLDRPIAKKPGLALWAAVGTITLLVLAACAGSEQPVSTDEEREENPASAEENRSEPEVDPTATVAAAPTAIQAPDFADISSVPSYAGRTPEETFDQYLIDAIQQQVYFQRAKLDMRIRYQNPTVLTQDMGGLILNIDMLENRSRRTVLRERDATFEVELDIRVTYADGDTSTETCAWTVVLQRVDELWYVTNPGALAFTNCVER